MLFPPPLSTLPSGSTTASYDNMSSGSVVLTAPQPRAALKTRTRGAKQPACGEMCPADEREQRTAERQLHPYERLPGEYATTPQLAVKKYQRSRKCVRWGLGLCSMWSEKGVGGVHLWAWQGVSTHTSKRQDRFASSLVKLHFVCPTQSVPQLTAATPSILTPLISLPPPDAGEETDNSALRTWPALAATLAHLRGLLEGLGAPDWANDNNAIFQLLEAHRFLWDR